jgi:hypothetical protein
MADAFLTSCQRLLEPVNPLSRANIVAFRAALAFYRYKRGKGERAQDVSTFFKKKGLADDFDHFLRNGGRAYRKDLEKKWARFESLLTEMAEKPKTKAATA